MTAFLCVISALAGAFAGFWAGKPHWTRARDLLAAVEAHNRNLATQRSITDAIEQSKSGGAADPTDWHRRLRDNAK